MGFFDIFKSRPRCVCCGSRHGVVDLNDELKSLGVNRVDAPQYYCESHAASELSSIEAAAKRFEDEAFEKQLAEVRLNDINAGRYRNATRADSIAIYRRLPRDKRELLEAAFLEEKRRYLVSAGLARATGSAGQEDEQFIVHMIDAIAATLMAEHQLTKHEFLGLAHSVTGRGA